jgi:hypothetical protein
MVDDVVDDDVALHAIAVNHQLNYAIYHFFRIILFFSHFLYKKTLLLCSAICRFIHQ